MNRLTPEQRLRRRNAVRQKLNPTDDRRVTRSSITAETIVRDIAHFADLGWAADDPNECPVYQELQRIIEIEGPEVTHGEVWSKYRDNIFLAQLSLMALADPKARRWADAQFKRDMLRCVATDPEASAKLLAALPAGTAPEAQAWLQQRVDDYVMGTEDPEAPTEEQDKRKARRRFRLLRRAAEFKDNEVVDPEDET